jgi:hypothetical protein
MRSKMLAVISSYSFFMGLCIYLLEHTHGNYDPSLMHSLVNIVNSTSKMRHSGQIMVAQHLIFNSWQLLDLNQLHCKIHAPCSISELGRIMTFLVPYLAQWSQRSKGVDASWSSCSHGHALQIYNNVNLSVHNNTKRSSSWRLEQQMKKQKVLIYGVVYSTMK